MKNKFLRASIMVALISIATISGYNYTKAQQVEKPSLEIDGSWYQTMGYCGGSSMTFCCTERRLAYHCSRYACAC